MECGNSLPLFFVPQSGFFSPAPAPSKLFPAVCPEGASVYPAKGGALEKRPPVVVRANGPTVLPNRTVGPLGRVGRLTRDPVSQGSALRWVNGWAFGPTRKHGRSSILSQNTFSFDLTSNPQGRRCSAVSPHAMRRFAKIFRERGGGGGSRRQWLFVESTLVTDVGVKKLQQALPKCGIRH